VGARPGEVLAAHGAGSSQHEDNQNRRCRTPIVGSGENKRTIGRPKVN